MTASCRGAFYIPLCCSESKKSGPARGKAIKQMGSSSGASWKMTVTDVESASCNNVKAGIYQLARKRGESNQKVPKQQQHKKC